MEEAHYYYKIESKRKCKIICLALIVTLLLLFSTFKYYYYTIPHTSESSKTYVVTKLNLKHFYENHQEIIKANTIITFEDTDILELKQPLVLDKDIKIVFGSGTVKTALACPTFDDLAMIHVTNGANVELEGFRISYCFYVHMHIIEVDAFSSLSIKNADITYLSSEEVNIIVCYESSLYLKNVVFKSNILKNYQLLRFKSSYVDIRNVVFDSNKASGSFADGIVNGEESQLLMYRMIANENRAVGDGGFLCCKTCILYINKSYFNKNEASSDGGAIYVYVDSILNIRNTQFNKNKAYSVGGGIFATATKTNLINVNFEENYAGYYSAAIYTYLGTLCVNNSKFVNNAAESYASVAYINNLEKVEVLNTEFIDNYDTNDFGIAHLMHISGGEFQNVTMLHNVGVQPGAIKFTNSSFVFDDCKCISNEGSKYGLFYLKDKSQLVVTNSELVENKGDKSSCVYIDENSVFIAENTLFKDNVAEKGSIAYVKSEGNMLAFKYCKFDNNTGKDTSDYVYEKYPGTSRILIIPNDNGYRNAKLV